jgi:hypothetical protein
MTENYLGYTFGNLRIPCIVFQADKYKFEDVIIDYRFDPKSMKFDDLKKEWLYQPEFGLPEDISANLRALVDKRKREAEEKGRLFFDGQLVKLAGYSMHVRKEDILSEDEKPVLKISPSSWFAYQATNRSLEEKILIGNDGKPTTIMEKYRIDPLILDDVLANVIGVSAVIISEPDHAMYFVQRGSKNDQYPNLYGVGAAGFMNRLRDSIAGVPNPFKTIQNETEQEAGIKCSLNDFTLFSVARALDDLHGELFGVIRTPMTIQEILSAPKTKKYESLNPITVPFEPKEVLKYVTKTIEKIPDGITSGQDAWIVGNTPEWVPAHAVATIQALEDEYGHERVMNELKNL